MTDEEAWVHYEREAIDHVVQQGREWKQLKEAVRIMRLIPHKYAASAGHILTKTLKSPRRHPKTTKGRNVQGKHLPIRRHPHSLKHSLNIQFHLLHKCNLFIAVRNFIICIYKTYILFVLFHLSGQKTST